MFSTRRLELDRRSAPAAQDWRVLNRRAGRKAQLLSSIQLTVRTVQRFFSARIHPAHRKPVPHSPRTLRESAITAFRWADTALYVLPFPSRTVFRSQRPKRGPDHADPAGTQRRRKFQRTLGRRARRRFRATHNLLHWKQNNVFILAKTKRVGIDRRWPSISTAASRTISDLRMALRLWIGNCTRKA